MFTKPKVPGWVAVALLVFNNIPDFKSRIDFWLDIAQAGDGYITPVASAVSSPYFNFAILAFGLLWLGLVGEPKKGVQRHPAWPIFGWSVIAITGCAMFLAIGSGYFEVRVREVAAGRWGDDRHLTFDQYTMINKVFKSIASDFRAPIWVSAASDPESTGYAIEIMKALAAAGVKVSTADPNMVVPIPMRALDTLVKGVFVQVPDTNSISITVKELVDGLNRSGIPITKYYHAIGMPDVGFVLTIGLK
jgi:hypothetical protein